MACVGVGRVALGGVGVLGRAAGAVGVGVDHVSCFRPGLGFLFGGKLLGVVVWKGISY